jgi:hypothetical protein
MERILQSAPFTASETFYEDGVAVDPGVVTIGITRADGTVLVAPLTATAGSGVGARTYALTIANTLLLDTLTLTWTSATKGIRKSMIEIAGGFLFTLADARAIRLGSSSSTDTIGTRYSTAEVAAMRTSVEQAIEDEYGAALVPRYERETIDGSPLADTNLNLKWPLVRSVREASITGISVLSSVEIDSILGVYYSTGWTAGRRNVIVGYEHGLDRPPERIRRGGLLLLKRWLVEGPVDDRMTSMSNDDGTFSLATPGRGGSIFGLPELDASIQASPYRVGVA